MTENDENRDRSTDPPRAAKDEIDPETLYERMQPLEPYTTGELAELLDIPRQLARELLDRLKDTADVRKKEPEPDRVIWIRQPPAIKCPECGHRFEIKFLHPVLSTVKFCPRCGRQI